MQQPRSSLQHISLHHRHLKSLHTRFAQPQQAKNRQTQVCRGKPTMSSQCSSTLRLVPHRRQQQARMRLSQPSAAP